MSYQKNWENIKEIVSRIPMPEAQDTRFLFGGGLRGSLSVSYAREELEVTAICDNSTEKQGMTIEGLPCIAPQELSDYSNPFVFISTIKYYPDIHRQLKELGVRHCGLDAYIVWKHLDDFERVIQLLDDRSKEIYTGILLCYVSGDLGNAEQYYCDNQYFCLPKFRSLRGAKGAFVDCGAFVGDTLEEIIKNSLDTASRIYAFEPEKRTFAALKKRTSFLCDIWALEPERIVCEQMGVGEKNSRLSFRDYRTDLANTSFSYVSSENKDGAEVVALDTYFAERGEKEISFIKADIEGFEWAMLHGAHKTIQRCKPKLAICIYHSIFDYFQIPLYLKALVPEYHFAVRHHTDIDEETVLYCYI